MSYDISNRIFICNDSELIFGRSVSHIFLNKKNIAIFSNDFATLKKNGRIYSKIYRCEFNQCEMFIDFGFAKIFLLPIDECRICGLAIEKAFIIYDYNDLLSNKFINRVISRCRL